MSRGRAVAGGAAVLVGSQAMVTLVQIGTGAATARLLAPSAFGAFAAAMAITGILGVVLTSATATAVLREPDLTDAQVWKLWPIALVQGVVGATVAFLAASAWAALYHSPTPRPWSGGWRSRSASLRWRSPVRRCSGASGGPAPTR